MGATTLTFRRMKEVYEYYVQNKLEGRRYKGS
jgi:hypothetical protein